jgi:hypothetical protein
MAGRSSRSETTPRRGSYSNFLSRNGSSSSEQFPTGLIKSKAVAAGAAVKAA